MKYLVWLICFIASSGGALAQVPGDSIPTKGANVIIIQTSLSDDEAYTAVGRALIDMGFAFKGDERFKTIKTDEVPLPKEPAFQFVCMASIQKGTIKLTGTLRNVVGMGFGGAYAQAGAFPVEYRTANITMHRKGFLLLDDVARRLKPEVGGTQVTYQKR